MAKLPDKYSLPSVTPSGPGTVISPAGLEVAARAAGAEAQALGQSLSANREMARAVSGFNDMVHRFGADMAERQARLDYSRAKMDWTKANISTVNSFRNDQDFTTYGPRYSEAAVEARNEIAQRIRNPLLRERFMSETDIDMMNATVDLNEKALKMENSITNAETENLFAEMQTLLSQTTDEMAQLRIIDNFRERIDTDVRNGAKTKVEGERIKRAFVLAYARARSASMEDDELLEQLNKAKSSDEHWLHFMPATERANLEKTVEKRLEVGQKEQEAEWLRKESQRAADGLLLTYSKDGAGGYKSAVDAAKSQYTGKMRDAVLQRLDQAYARMERIESEQREELLERANAHIDAGGSIAGMPPEIYRDLGPSGRQQVEAYYDFRTRPRDSEKKRAFTAEVFEDYLVDPKSILEYDRAYLYSNISPKYVDKAREYHIAASAAAKAETPVNVSATEGAINKEINGALDAIGLPNLGGDASSTNKQERAVRRKAFRDEVELFVESWRAQHDGKSPPISEVKKYVNEISVELYLRKETGWPSFVREMLPDDWNGEEKFLFELEVPNWYRAAAARKDASMTELEIRRAWAGLIQQNRGVVPEAPPPRTGAQ